MNAFNKPVTILKTPGRFWLGGAASICRLSGRGWGFWRLVSYGAAIYRSWRECPTIGPDGKPFWIDLRYTQFSWLVQGWRTSAIDSVLAGLPLDAVALDIGAHIGVTCRLMASRFENGHVYAFEPSPSNFRQLGVNCTGIQNITCRNIALGRNTGELSFSSDATNPLLRRITPNGTNTISVQSMRLADWIAATGLQRLDFIKIDVEGFEEDVLVPAKEALEKFRPVIFFEFYAPFAKERSFYRGERLFPLFDSLNYSVYRLDECGGKHRNFDQAGIQMTSDYVGIPSRD